MKKGSKDMSSGDPVKGRRGSDPSTLPRTNSFNRGLIRYSSLPSAGTSSEGETTENEDDTKQEIPKPPQTPTESKMERKKSDEGSKKRRRSSLVVNQTELEIAFMSLVNAGNVLEAREFLVNSPEETLIFDINKTNFDGYSPLHIAVHRQDEEMLKVLLSVDGIKIYDTFFYAIKEGDLGMVNQFIQFESNRPNKDNESSGPQRKHSKGSIKKDGNKSLIEVLDKLQEYKDKTFNTEFDDDITPLMLSAQCGHYELISLFYDAGQRMKQIQEIDCKTDFCKSKGELKISYMRLHIYQAISNPVYILFMALQFHSVDPILESFHLISDLKKIGIMEPEVKQEYNELILNLQNFTGELVGLCRDDTEVDLLLKQKAGFKGNTKETYPRLILAVQTGEIEFVTHPHVQKVLYSEWIRGFEAWEQMNGWKKLLEFVWRTGLLPFISIWQLLHSRCWTCGTEFSTRMSAPVSRFIHSFGSYVIFLSLLIIEVNLDAFGDKFDINDKSPPRSSGLRILIEITIFIFVISHIVSTVKQFCFMPQMFFHQLWNIYEIINHILFILAYIFWIIAWINAPPRGLIIHDIKYKIGGREYWHPNNPLLIGEGFFSCGLIMSFGRIFRVLQLHPRFGPLQIALGKMLKNMCRLIILFLTVILAFAAGMCMLYKPYTSWKDSGEDGAKIVTQKSAYTNIFSAAETLFWGLYGMAGTDNFEILTRHFRHDGAKTHHEMTEIAGKSMYAVYHVVATIVLLNTIVAMLTGAAGEVFENVDKEFKLGRTEIWLLYGRDMRVPAPLNILAILRNTTILRCLGIGGGGRKYKRGFNMDRCCFADEVTPESDKILRTAYSMLIRNLLERYFHAKATFTLNEPAKQDQVNKVRETMGELREKIKLFYAGVAGVAPIRKTHQLTTIASAMTKFKKGIHQPPSTPTKDLPPILRKSSK